MKQTVDVIKRMRAAGFLLFPCAGKVPSRKGVNWRETTLNQYTDDELAYQNYAVALKPDQMVVDVDPRNYAPGDNPLRRLVLLVGEGAFKASFRVKTGGGGLHIYFRLHVPEGLRVADSKEFRGINFKHHGGYVLGPGSIHPDTKRVYEIVGGDPGRLVEAPDALVNVVCKPSAPTADFSLVGTSEFKDDKATQDRFSVYLRGASPSIEGQGGNANAFKVAARGRDLGLSPRVALAQMLETWNARCVPPWGEDELRGVVVNAYKYSRGALGSAHPEADFRGVKVPADIVSPDAEKVSLPEVVLGDRAGTDADIDWAQSKQGAPTRCFKNLLNWMMSTEAGLRGIIGYNEFSMQAEFTGTAPWHGGKLPSHPAVSDNDLKQLKAHLAVKHGFEKSVSEIEEAVVVTAKRNAFHPVRDYLRGLEWDGVPRIETWLRDYLGTEDSPYSRALSRKVLCGAVTRIFFPGVKFDHVLVLEGAQDLGKSSVCSILSGKWGGDFTINPHDKDTVQLLQGRWIVELAELEVGNRVDTDALKAFVTRQSDRIRLAYGRLPMEFPRQSIFIASKNPEADNSYLKDATGNRRWWPIMCAPKGGQVDFKAFQDVRDQLWAEATEWVRNRREALFMDTPELKDIAAREVAKRHAPHPWTDRLGSWIQDLPEPRNFLTTREIFVDAMGGIDKQLGRREALSIAQALRILGWTPSEKFVNGRLLRGFVPVEGKAVLPLVRADMKMGIEDTDGVEALL